MSSTDSRHIADKTETGRSERLFRAAVSAFCSLTRPTRREIAQLEDLVLPLFDCVSTEALRYVAAALSESDFAPGGLVRRLADQPVDVAAPLLLRSHILNEVDLIALIGRHGIPHARAIARRADLNPVIDDLIRALMVRVDRDPEPISSHHTVPVDTEAESLAELLELQEIFAEADEVFQPEPLPAPSGKADAVREQLRTMMRPAAEPQDVQPLLEMTPLLTPAEVSKLRDMALTGNRDFFLTALADALGIAYAQARLVCARSTYGDLIYALKSLEIADDTAFVLTAATFPSLFAHAESIRIFLDRYRLCHREAARDRVRTWKADSIADTVRAPKRYVARRLEAANSEERLSILRAS